MATRARLRLLSAHLQRPRGWAFLVGWTGALPALLGVLLGACATPQAGSSRLIAIDDAGDTVRLAAPATRVVSLSPATTELAFALGAGERLVGRTRWCDYPAAARAVPDVGDGMPPNIEAVLATTPDLVLLYRSAANQEAAARLRDAGVAVLQVDMNRLADVGRVARLLGPLLGRAAAGDSLARAFEAELEAATTEGGPRCAADAAGCPSVLLLAWDQPPIAIGAGSFQGEILERAGARNLFADIAGPSATVSIEAIASRDPDLILVGDSGEPSVSRRPEWRVVGAVRARRFVRFGSPAFGRPSPRAPGLIRALRQALHEARR